jgi:hypothetical protein
VKTLRAEIIEACIQAAESSGSPVIAQMPRMAEFYRKRTNEQLRAARASGDSVALADAKAKLELLRWAESWMRGPRDTWPLSRSSRDHAERMNQELMMIGFALQYLVRAYSDHPQFRPEWRGEAY